jgi:sugar phosphate isomerase/epimerase
MHLTRRDLMTGSALALTCAGVSRGAGSPSFPLPTRAKDRIAVASYSFRSLIDTPKNRTTRLPGDLIPLKDFAARMAQKYDVHGVELLGQHFPSRESSYLEELRAAVQAAGSRIINIPASVGASVYDVDANRRAIAVGNAKKWVDTAVAVNCNSVRIHMQGGSPNADLAAESLRAVAEYGERKGVVVNLENDDPKSEDAFFVASVIDQAKHPWLRALPDFCNSMLSGNEKFNYDAVTAMFQRAYNVSHVKDAEVDGGKLYRVDLARTFAIARESGYRGWFSIEWEGEGDVWVENARLIEESVRLSGG